MVHILKYKSSKTRSLGIILYINNPSLYGFFLEIKLGKTTWIIGF
jgi:hypothetical protein